MKDNLDDDDEDDEDEEEKEEEKEDKEKEGEDEIKSEKLVKSNDLMQDNIIEYKESVDSKEVQKEKNERDIAEIIGLKTINHNLLKMKFRELYDNIELHQRAVSMNSELNLNKINLCNN